MSKLTQKEIAMKNTFTCENSKYYWCYICEDVLLDNETFDIDHIKPESCFSVAEKNTKTFKKYGTSFNPGLGVAKKEWISSFDEDLWFYNNLVLVHRKCNQEKGDEDYTSSYIKIIKE